MAFIFVLKRGAVKTKTLLLISLFSFTPSHAAILDFNVSETIETGNDYIALVLAGLP